MQIDFLKVDVDGCDAWFFDKPETRKSRGMKWMKRKWLWNFIPIGDSQFEMIGYSIQTNHIDWSWRFLIWSVVFSKTDLKI